MSMLRSSFRFPSAIVVAALIGLQGCGEGLSETTAARPAAVDPPGCAALLAADTSGRAYEEDIQRQLPLSRYLSFPDEDRTLMQRADIESVHANGGGPEGMRASNRWHCIALQLQGRGWCWGGGDIAAEDRWLRCSEIPDDPPLPRELPYPESEIVSMYPTSAPALDVGFANVGRLFAPDDDADLPTDYSVQRMRREADDRLSACTDQLCRQAVESDLLNRLRFAQGESSTPIADIPWRTGAFRPESPRVLGSLNLLPVAGRHLLLSVSTSEAAEARWMCENVIAKGELGPDGVAQMTTLGEHWLRFTLRSSGSGGIELLPIDEEREGYSRLCGVGGTIFGRYRAMPSS